MVKLGKLSWNFIIFAACFTVLLLQPPSVNSESAGASMDSEVPEDHHSKQFRLFRKFEKGQRSVTVYEGERLEIFCTVELLVTGVNESEVAHNGFKWFKDNTELNLTAMEENKDDKVVVISPLEFDYSEAKAHHRGRYRCSGEYNGTTSSFEYYVRVKGNLFFLWPLGGICVQVVVLGLIFFVYEKRRDRLELEEED